MFWVHALTGAAMSLLMLAGISSVIWPTGPHWKIFLVGAIVMTLVLVLVPLVFDLRNRPR
jgi:hypothetical protein